jgi:hypothetical protein
MDNSAKSSNSIEKSPSPQLLSQKNYNCNHKFFGRAIIFNQVNFVGNFVKLKKRKGSRKDASDLKRVLEGVGFENVEIYKDLKTMEIFDVLERGEFIKVNERQKNIFNCVILQSQRKTTLIMTVC